MWRWSWSTRAASLDGGLHLSALLTMMKVLLEAAAAMMTAVTMATGWRSHINIRCNKDAHLPRIA